MSTGKQTKRERLRAMIEKPYVKLPLIITVLTAIGTALILLMLLAATTYALATVVGIPTIQLVTGIVSAASAVASASAAIWIWRGNVQTRKTILIDRVLGPAYSEIRRSREVLESWKAEAKEVALRTPFLNQVASDWLYYTLDSRLRTELENLHSLVAALEQQRDLCKSIASPILLKAASETFGVAVPNISTVYLWRSHSWSEGQTQGENGRMPTWELVVDSLPLSSPPGYHVHSLQIVDFNSIQQYSLSLLDQNRERLNVVDFDRFWELARSLATSNSTIVSFRDARNRTLERCADLEQKLDSEIRHLR